jgi:hypothetical protein
LWRGQIGAHARKRIKNRHAVAEMQHDLDKGLARLDEAILPSLAIEIII